MYNNFCSWQLQLKVEKQAAVSIRRRQCFFPLRQQLQIFVVYCKERGGVGSSLCLFSLSPNFCSISSSSSSKQLTLERIFTYNEAGAAGIVILSSIRPNLTLFIIHQMHPTHSLSCLCHECILKMKFVFSLSENVRNKLYWNNFFHIFYKYTLRAFEFLLF